MTLAVPPSRRHALWGSGLGALALFGLLAALDLRLRSTGGPGIVPFELAGGERRARQILAAWGAEGRQTARVSLWLDYGFLVLYGMFLALAAGSIRARARRRAWRGLAAVGGIAIAAAIGAALFDALENAALLVVLDGGSGSGAPELAAAFASGKFLLTLVVVGYLLAGLGRRGLAWRPRRARTTDP